MKGDFSRSSYDEKKNYSGVLKQQGRVSLDADWNEQLDIIGHERETRTEDIIGHCGAPGEGGGFGVTLFTDDLKDLRIPEGRFYAAGQLCEPRLHAKVPVVGFPTADRAQLAAPAADGRLFAEEEWLSVCLGTDEAGTEAKVSHAEVIDGATVLTFDRNVWSTGSPTFGTVQRLLLYRKQVDYPIDDLEAAPPSEPGRYLAYLDVWKRHVTAIEDPAIREKALGGPDTATRVQMVSQVKLYHLASGLRLPGGRRLRGERRLLPESVLPPGRRLPLDGLEYTCCDAWTDFEDEAESRKSNGRLKTSVEVPPPTDLCHFAARGGYTGLENRLYRVEIHAPGSIGTATFKWSRDNGSVVFPIVEFSTETVGKVTLGGVRKDQIPCLQAGDWVEVSDDTSDLRGESGTLLRVAQAYDDATGQVELGGAASGYSVEAHAKLRRWDHKLHKDPITGADTDDYPIPISAGPILLEDGVTVEFAGDNFQVGDYWAFAARTVDGSVEELNFELPQGIEHHYCPLALVTWGDAGFSDVSDCRNLFAPLTGMTSFFMAGGDGQEAGPGDVFPEPLRVVVARGSHPVNGAQVEFRVDGDGGQLWDKSGGSDPWKKVRVVTTNEQGIAQVLARPICSPPCPPGPIRVTATLKEAPGCTCIGEHAPLWFGLYLANPVIFYGGGDGQSGPAGKRLPARLKIVAAPRAWPHPSVMSAEGLPVAGPRHIRFELPEEDNGSLSSDGGPGGQQVDVEVSATGGVARCFWTLGTAQNKKQQVAAWLTTDEQKPEGRSQLPFPIVFNARICSGVLERCPKFLDELRADGIVRGNDGKLGLDVSWTDNLELSYTGGVAYVRGCRFEIPTGTVKANESATAQALLVDPDGTVRLLYKEERPEKYALIAIISTYEGRITQVNDARRDLYHLDEQVQVVRERAAAGRADRRQFSPLLASTLKDLRLCDGRNREFKVKDPAGLAFDGQSVWVASPRIEGQVVRIDRSAVARLAGVVIPVEVNGHKCLTSRAAFDGHRYVWFTSPFCLSEAQYKATAKKPTGESAPSFTQSVNNQLVLVDTLRPGAAQIGVTVGAGPDPIAFDGDFMWVGCQDHKLHVVNCESREVVRTVDLGRGTPQALLFDGQFIWVACASEVAANRLLRIEKPWGEPEDFSSTISGSPKRLAFDGARVWVACEESVLKEAKTKWSVVSLDAVKPKQLVRHVVSGLAGVGTVLFDGRYVWVSHNWVEVQKREAYGLLRIDAALGAASGSVEIPEKLAPAHGVFDGTHLWLSSGPDEKNAREYVRKMLLL